MFFYNQLAIHYLQRDSNVHENIHQARLCFKRMRSFLRLGRTGLGEELYQKYNVFYRDQSRSLSQLRDITAISETLQGFIKTRRTKSAKSFLNHYKNSLVLQRRQHIEKIIESNIKADVIKALQVRSEEILKWEFTADAAEVFSSGVKRIYKRGKRLFVLTESIIDDHNMHEWRKQVKYLWYHLSVLTTVWPNIMKAWAKELQNLSQLLGSQHDLVLLEISVQSLDPEPSDKQIINNLKSSIKLRKQRLEKSSLLLGSKIYAETPSSIGERLKAYWK
jgi:CHAD domain-containing protein